MLWLGRVKGLGEGKCSWVMLWELSGIGNILSLNLWICNYKLALKIDKSVYKFPFEYVEVINSLDLMGKTQGTNEFKIEQELRKIKTMASAKIPLSCNTQSFDISIASWRISYNDTAIDK